MKRVISALLLLALVCSFTACASKTEDIASTKENFSEYFFVKITQDDFEQWVDALGLTNYTTTGTVNISIAKSVKLDKVIVQGKLHIRVDDGHLLYKENKLPIDITIQVDGNGYGSETFSITHGRGAYGGYRIDQDAYFVVESISGKVLSE